jgi:hypothetical protein
VDEIRRKEHASASVEDVEKWWASAAKAAINDTIWRFAPPNLTLSEAEAIACAWYGNMQDLWDKFSGDRRPT